MKIITSIDSPDIDGVACSIAYAELLNQIGTEAKAVYFGDIGLEVDFVRDYTNHLPIEKHSGVYDAGSEIVLVDTADPDAIDPDIPLERVCEIYDHRVVTSTDIFINAKKHIELVVSCATLITEEFIKAGIFPTKNTAIYLYSAIISNTINFKNSVTTPRDIEAYNWLKEITRLDEEYISKMFKAKSDITPDNIYEVLFQDFAIKIISGTKIGIAQIEMVNVDRMLSELKSSLIESLKRLSAENGIDYIFFTGIDLIKGYNIFYTIDEASGKLFSKVLDIPNLHPGYKTNEIIMRKQIWPKIESVLLTTQ
jgi:manganese-dependent inorganic pyrophosphatase